MVHGVPVEKTICDCDDLKEFQKIVKVSSKYLCGWHNGKQLLDKTFRVFASKDPFDGCIGKIKIKNGQYVTEKFANTPEHCFIWNDDVNGVPVPEDLDKQYYVDVAKKRLEQFGVR
jgi:DNA polymerase